MKENPERLLKYYNAGNKLNLIWWGETLQCSNKDVPTSFPQVCLNSTKMIHFLKALYTSLSSQIAFNNFYIQPGCWMWRFFFFKRAVTN